MDKKVKKEILFLLLTDGFYKIWKIKNKLQNNK